MAMRILFLVCSISPVFAQSLPPLDPTIQLQTCRSMQTVLLTNWEQSAAYATQFLNEIASLKKQLAEASARKDDSK
jgi:hypothetical protein